MSTLDSRGCGSISFNLMVEHSPATLDGTFGALEHRVRREMLDVLRAGPRRVTDLAEPFQFSLAAASKHIKVLEAAGLITRTVSGRDHVLSLAARPLEEARAWIEAYRSFWELRLDALEKHLRSGSRR
jgi:DNA-binding transcriptional ArsR family regulator